MFAAVVVLYIGNFFLVVEAQALRNKTFGSKLHSSYEAFLYKWRGYQVLFQGYNEDSMLQQSFFLLYSMRLAFPMIITAGLTNLPIVQIGLYVLIGLLMLVFIIWKKPLVNKTDLANVGVLEGLMLLVNISILVLVMFDSENDAETLKSFFGDVIIAGNFCTDIIAIIFLTLKIAQGIQHANKLRQKKADEEKSAWLQLIFIPLKQGAMGFEQVQMLELTKPQSSDDPNLPIIQVSSFPLENLQGDTSRREEGVSETIDSSRIGLFPSAKRRNQESFPTSKIIHKGELSQRVDTMDITMPMKEDENSGFPIQKIGEKSRDYHALRSMELQEKSYGDLREEQETREQISQRIDQEAFPTSKIIYKDRLEQKEEAESPPLDNSTPIGEAEDFDLPIQRMADGSREYSSLKSMELPEKNLGELHEGQENRELKVKRKRVEGFSIDKIFQKSELNPKVEAEGARTENMTSIKAGDGERYREYTTLKSVESPEKKWQEIHEELEGEEQEAKEVEERKEEEKLRSFQQEEGQVKADEQAEQPKVYHIERKDSHVGQNKFQVELNSFFQEGSAFALDESKHVNRSNMGENTKKEGL